MLTRRASAPWCSSNGNGWSGPAALTPHHDKTLCKEALAATRCASLGIRRPLTCVGPTPGGASCADSPSVVIGVGAERNFGTFFGRATVEADTAARYILIYASNGEWLGSFWKCIVAEHPMDDARNSDGSRASSKSTCRGAICFCPVI
jgi:hypothetical protein